MLVNTVNIMIGYFLFVFTENLFDSFRIAFTYAEEKNFNLIFCELCD